MTGATAIVTSTAAPTRSRRALLLTSGAVVVDGVMTIARSSQLLDDECPIALVTLGDRSLKIEDRQKS
jgi:hypothetical protein